MNILTPRRTIVVLITAVAVATAPAAAQGAKPSSQCAGNDSVCQRMVST